MYRSLSVLDGAILVISAKDGVQAQTRILFHALQKMNIPTIIFINKIDQDGINLTRGNSTLNVFAKSFVNVACKSLSIIKTFKLNLSVK